MTKKPLKKGPGMELPNCDDHIAIKKFLKQLHYEVTTILGAEVTSSKTTTNDCGQLIELARTLRESYAEFEDAKTAKKDAEKRLEHAARRKHVKAEECHTAVAEKTTSVTEYETKLAKIFSIVVDYVDCRSHLQFAIDGEVNYKIPDTIPAMNIVELFVTEAKAQVA